MADDGEWFDFREARKGFAVQTGNINGQTGTGTASMTGATVHVMVNVMPFGRFDLELTLKGDTLSGLFSFMGVNMAKSYRRQ